MGRLKLTLTPIAHEMQRKVLMSPARFKVSAWGRQSGKSTYGTKKLAIKSWTTKKKIYWFIAPTYAQAKVHWRRMYNGLPHSCFLETSKTENFFRFLSGSYLFFKSGDNFNSLRTDTLDGVVIDEMRDQHRDLWPLVIRPMLMTTGGWGDIMGTPNGFDHFFDVAEQAKTSANWAFFHSSSICNPAFSQEEFELARSEMDEAQFAQEIMAEFRDMTVGRAYKTFGDHNRVKRNPWYDSLPFSPYLPIVVACDFNLNPMAWTIGQTKGGKWYWFDEIYIRNSHTPEAAVELLERVRKYKEMGHKAHPTLIMTGDATSKAGQRAAAAQSDYDIVFRHLKDGGVQFSQKIPDANPGVKNRVNTMNAKFKAADGTVSCWILEKDAYPGFGCPHFIKDVQRVVWKAGVSGVLEKTKDPTLTHSSDGPGYAVCELSPLKGVNEVGRLRILTR